MTKYQLVIDNTVDVPVNLDIGSGRVRKNFFFHLTGKRLSVDEWQAHFGPRAENPHMPVADFLREHISGWRGQQLVVDETGTPAEFNAESFDAMLSVVGVEMLIFIAYQKAIFASDGDAGRRKNSAS